MKKVHKERLRKLAEYLLTQVPEEQFDMRLFRDGDHDQHICGTAGCALGWSPAIMAPSTHRKYLRSVEEGESVNKVYAVISEEYFGIDTFHPSKIWDYLFSSFWSDTDNTPQGAGARILYLLDHGVPDCFRGGGNPRHWDTSHYQHYLTTYNNEAN